MSGFTYHDLLVFLPAAIMCHVTEEFVFPGGFIEWYKQFRPALASGIKPGYIVWINALMIGLCVLPVYFGVDSISGITIWYTLSAMGAVNACFHIIGVYSLRRYSPGVVTGIFLYIPLFVFASWTLLTGNVIGPIRASVCLAAAIAYHVFADRGHKIAADRRS